MDIQNDPRYTYVGQLPSRYLYNDFNDILARPFTIHELMQVSTALSLKAIQYIIRVLQVTTDIDVNQLVDADFIYLLGWQKVYSYPKTPTTASWQCKNTYLEDLKGNRIHDNRYLAMTTQQLKNKGIVRVECNSNRTYIAHRARMKTTLLPENFKLEGGLDFPRVGTLLEAQELRDDPKYSAFIDELRWIKEGKTLKDKFDWVEDNDAMHLLDIARKYSAKFLFGLQEVVPLECLACDHKQTKTRVITPFQLLPFNTEKAILEMQDNLLKAYHTPPDNNMPSKTFLFMHSSLVKEAQEKAQKALIRKNKQNSNQMLGR